MNNRLNSILRGSVAPTQSNDDQSIFSSSASIGNDMVDVELASQPKSIEEFLATVETIKTDIQAVSDATAEINKLSATAILSFTTKDEQKISTEIQTLALSAGQQAKRTKMKLEQLQKETKQLAQTGKLKDHERRIRESWVFTLTKKFVDTTKEYQQAQLNYKQKSFQKAKRQIQVVQPDITDEEVDTILRSSEGGREELYQQAILDNRHMNSQIKSTYNKVASKHHDIVVLEQSVAEIHKLFLDLALLTEYQGEALDEIDVNVRHAEEYVGVANEDIQKSLDIQKSIRKKQCFILIVVAICMVVLVWFLFGRK